MAEADILSNSENDHTLPMYDQAVRLVTDQRQASISWLQRRLRVGYNRAARMIERMEREGVVSSSDGVRPREVCHELLPRRYAFRVGPSVQGRLEFLSDPAAPGTDDRALLQHIIRHIE